MAAKKKATKKKAAKKGPVSTRRKRLGPRPTGNPVGRPPYVPSDETRDMVQTMAGLGLTREEIALCITNPKTGKPISTKTLNEHFSEQLAAGAPKLKAKIAGSLAKKAISSDHPQAASSAMFIMKCRFGWREKSAVEHSGTIGGVLVAPGAVSPEQWIAAAELSNAGTKDPNEEGD